VTETDPFSGKCLRNATRWAISKIIVLSLTII